MVIHNPVTIVSSGQNPVTLVASDRSSQNEVILLGDSLTTLNQWVDAGSYHWTHNRGYFPYTQGRLGGRLRCLDVAATAGDKIADAAARMSGIIAKKPGYLVVLIGINDVAVFSAEADYAVAWAAMKTGILNVAVAAGIVPVVCTIPAAGTINNATKIKGWHYMNNQIVSYAVSTQNVLLAHLSANTYTNAASEAQPLAAYVEADLLHPSANGAELIGIEIGRAMSDSVPAIALPASTAADPYNSAGTAGLQFSTALATGTKAGTPTPSGTVPTGWTVTGLCTNSTGVTIAGQMVAATDGGMDWFEVTLSGAGMAGQTNCAYDIHNSNWLTLDEFAVGDWIEWGFEYSLAAGYTNFMGILCDMHQRGASESFVYFPRALGGSENLEHADEFTGVRSIPYQIQASTTDLRLYIQCRHANTQTAAASVLSVRNPFIRKIENFSADNSLFA